MTIETSLQNIADALNRIADAISTTGGAATVATPAADPEAGTAPRPRGRPRAAKPETPEPPVAPTAPAAAPEAPPEPAEPVLAAVTAAAQAEAKPLTKSDIQRAAIALVHKLGAVPGRAKLTELLAPFGAASVSLVAEAHYPALNKAIIDATA